MFNRCNFLLVKKHDFTKLALTRTNLLIIILNQLTFVNNGPNIVCLEPPLIPSVGLKGRKKEKILLEKTANKTFKVCRQHKVKRNKKLEAIL